MTRRTTPSALFGPLSIACLLAVTSAACDGGGARPADTGASILVFDAAMLRRDAGSAPGTADAGAPDAGAPARDARPEAFGDGGTEPACRGVSTSCSSLLEYECREAFGCGWTARCAGGAQSCYHQFTSYACNSQDYCYWSYSRDECSGSARSCSSYSDRYGCRRQGGCRWEAACSGTAVACDSHWNQVSCQSQPGCYWR